MEPIRKMKRIADCPKMTEETTLQAVNLAKKLGMLCRANHCAFPELEVHNYPHDWGRFLGHVFGGEAKKDITKELALALPSGLIEPMSEVNPEAAELFREALRRAERVP